MKEKKFEDILRKKLGEGRVDPPAGMWERIERDLPALGASPQPQVREPEIPRAVQGGSTIRIRVPRKLRVGYAAAASVLLVMLMIGLRQALKEDLMAVSDDPDNQDVINEMVDPEVREIIIPEKEIETQAEKPAGTSMQNIRKSIAAASGIGTYKFERRPQSIDASGILASFADTDELYVRPVGPRGGDGRHTDITSDKRTSGVPVDWVRVLAEEDRQSRRATPLNLALYSGDLGSSSRTTTAQNKNGGTLVVTESTDGPGLSLSGAPGINSESDQSIKHKMPLTFGLNVSFELLPRFSVETGLNYSYLNSESEMKGSVFDYTRKQKLHYLGIPVYLRYDFVRSNRFSFYGSAGGMLEKCVSSHLSQRVIGDSRSEDTGGKLKVKGFQPSVGANLGAEVKLYSLLGFYVEPGVNYYFSNNNQPESYRTEHRFNFSLRAGLRFRFE